MSEPGITFGWERDDFAEEDGVRLLLVIDKRCGQVSFNEQEWQELVASPEKLGKVVKNMRAVTNAVTSGVMYFRDRNQTTKVEPLVPIGPKPLPPPRNSPIHLRKLYLTGEEDEQWKRGQHRLLIVGASGRIAMLAVSPLYSLPEVDIGRTLVKLATQTGIVQADTDSGNPLGG